MRWLSLLVLAPWASPVAAVGGAGASGMLFSQENTKASNGTNGTNITSVSPPAIPLVSAVVSATAKQSGAQAAQETAVPNGSPPDIFDSSAPYTFVTGLTGDGGHPVGLTKPGTPGTSTMSAVYLTATDPMAVCNGTGLLHLFAEIRAVT